MQNIEKPVLSISLLVSNRIDTIRKCMESIRPLLTELSAELIVVDTVGEEQSDGSLAVAKEYADKIVRFEWCNDFAAARNVGLSLCRGEWFLFLDDDEWFEDVSEIVDFFRSGEYKNYQCATYKIHSYTEKKGQYYSVAALFRMVKRESETKFVGKVHEYLFPLRTPLKEFSAYIHHYGYVFDSEEEKKEHSERNLKLLRKEFEKNPWNMHVRVQMVQECMFLEELDWEAEQICEKTLNAEKKYYLSKEFQWIITAYVRLAHKKSDFNNVEIRAEMLRKRFPLNAMADYAISIIELDALCKLKQYEKGIFVLENALKKREFLLNNPEKKYYMQMLDFETFLDDSCFCQLLRCGILCYRKVGRITEAKELVRERFSKLAGPVLSISILVSRHIATVRKCLESIQALRAEVPSELIIVDTLGEDRSDGSVKIAREYTEHIIPFTWCDDFSEARNMGLKEAKGEWFLYLDDDEWFESTREIREFFLSGEYLEYNSATYLARNYKDKEGMAYQEDILGRMVRRGKTIEFVGCVNETFSHLYLPHKKLKDYVHHYGFVYENAEEKKRHKLYVRELLQKDLVKYPKNLRGRTQLTAILSLENPEEGLKVCKDTLAVCQDEKDSAQYQWQVAMLFNLMELAGTKAEEAEKWYQKLKKEETFGCNAEQVACFRMTRLWILSMEYAKAYLYAKTYLDLADHCVNEEEGSAENFQKYQTLECKEEMLTLGAFCAWKAGEYEAAWKYYENLPWETGEASMEDSLWKLFAMAEEQVDEDILFSIIKRTMRNEKLKSVLGKMMQQNPRVKQRIDKVLRVQRRKNANHSSAASNEKKPLLTISLLVSNRNDTIRKCMESLKPLLAAVPSELIAVDTVGEENSDGSLDIAREYTDNIVHFDWCDDFAAARNAGLERAQGEWFLFLDDDEWFESVDEIVHFFTSGEYLEYNSATYQIRNYKDTEGRQYSMATLGRMVRIGKNTRFIGRIHETFSAIHTPCKDFSDYVHHYGYAYADEEEKRAHIQRNIGLLEEELKENPVDLRIRAQMAMELANFDNEAALSFCNETFRLCVEEKEEAEFQWQLSLVFCLYEALGTGYAEAEVSYHELKNRFGFSETAENAICVQMTRICLLQEQNVKAHPYAERYFETLAYLSEHKEEAQQQMTADFARYRARNTYLEMLDFAAFAAWQAKDYDAAWKHYMQMPWEEEGYENEDGLWKVFAMSEENPRLELLYSIIRSCMKNKTMKSVIGKLMQKPEGKQKVSDTLESAFAWLSLPLEEFMPRIGGLLVKDGGLKGKAFWQDVLDRLQQDSFVKYTYLLYRMAEAELLQTVTATPDSNSRGQAGGIGEMMESCTRTGRAFYEALYRPECFSERGIRWMPADCQYNDILVRFLDGGKLKLPMLLEAAKLKPEMLPVIKAWLAELAKK